MCLAPVVLLGTLTLSEFNTNVAKQTAKTTGSGQQISISTCERGIGLNVMASTNGLYSADMQYGLATSFGDFSISFAPRVGISYVDHTVKELPQVTQFSVGAGVYVGYQQVRVGAELRHFSNAGITDGNIGLNGIGLVAGWAF